MTDLATYAREELTRAGLFDQDSDYDGMLGQAALEIVEVFAKQGHSGMSAAITTSVVEKLMRYEPLTPLTYEPDEWVDVSEASGEPMWQNRRKFSVFSNDGGKTHWDISEQEDAEPLYEQTRGSEMTDDNGLAYALAHAICTIEHGYTLDVSNAALIIRWVQASMRERPDVWGLQFHTEAFGRVGRSVYELPT